ncbi:MAG: transglycosylase SLT domain-containing protein [Proteobacteria bacterium]|nr:transglycosylase SLT domain-containing protein [Pseudomonadota bacterium]
MRAAIARAAGATGVDFGYLLAEARLESGLNPSARAATSSATGLYQFTDATWRSALDKYGAGLGLPGGPAGMALRYDPQASALMAARLAGENGAMLQASLGRAPDAAELYLAHFLGADGANRFLAALQTDPAQSAAALLPKAAAANQAVFYGDGGAPRSVGAVMDLLRGKVQAAMGAGGPPPPAPLATGQQLALRPGGPLAQEFAQASEGAAPLSATLRETFGAGAPAFVRAAYGKLQAMGL